MATVLIVGCGIAGPSLAIHLKNNGFNPVLFEKISKDKIGDVGGTLMLAPNGLRAFGVIGLSHKIIQNSWQVDLSLNTQADGTALSSMDLSFLKDKYGYPTTGIKRTTLQQILMDAVAENGIQVHLGKQLTSIEQDEPNQQVTAIFADGTKFTGSFLVGCDGLHSATRGSLFGPEKPQYTGLTQTLGLSPRPPTYKDHTIYNIYGINSHLVSYGYSTTHVAWATSTREPETPESWRSLSAEKIQEFKSESHFTKWAEPVPSLLKDAERIVKYGIYDRPALASWFKGRCVLLGDAAHPTGPHLGQGANQALEDCMILVKFLTQNVHSKSGDEIRISNESLEKAFSEYERIRIPRTSTLVLAARKQGELRACEGEEACIQRDNVIRHSFDNLDEVYQRLDEHSILCHTLNMADPMKLGDHIFQHILSFVNTELRYFAMGTCSSWAIAIKKSKDFSEVVIPDIRKARIAASNGHLDWLIFLYKIKKFKPETTTSLLSVAAENGNLECMKFLLKKGGKMKGNGNVAIAAASGGDFDCLKFAHLNGCTLSNIFFCNAAKHGNLEILKYARENGGEGANEWDGATSYQIASGGFLDCLKYIHQNGCDVSVAVDVAAQFGKLDCLRYLLHNGCNWTQYNSAVAAAASGGHLNILNYCQKKGLPLTDSQLCAGAARGDKIECFLYLRELGCEWDAATCSGFASAGNLGYLKYAHKNGCPWTAETCVSAARGGHLNCLIYAHENGCPWTSKTCTVAAEFGHLDCLIYATENGCEMLVDEVGDMAASGGFVECLKFALQQKQWETSSFFYCAGEKGKLSILKFLYKSGFPWPKWFCVSVARFGQLECLKYAVENGCELGDAIHSAKLDVDLRCFNYCLRSTCKNMKEWNELKSSIESTPSIRYPEECIEIMTIWKRHLKKKKNKWF